MSRSYWKQQVQEIASRLGKEQLSDKELFTSPEYANATQTWAEDMVYGACCLLRAQGHNISEKEEQKRASQLAVSVIYNDDEDAMTAATNGSQIVINSGNSLIQALDTQYLRHYAVQGFRVHEVGHMLFSDNKKKMQWYQSMLNGYWWPTTPTAEGVAEMSAKLKDTKWREIFMSIANSLRNALEDAYVENEIFTIFGGLPSIELATVDDVQIQRATSFMDSVNSEDDSTGKKTSKSMRVLSALMEQILLYAKYGILMIAGCDTEIQEMFDTIMPIIDGAKIERDPKKRLSMLNDVLCSCFEVLDNAVQDILKEMQNKSNSQQSSSGKQGGTPSSQTSGKNNQTGNNAGQSNPQPGQTNGNGQQNTGNSEQGQTVNAGQAFPSSPDESTKKAILEAIKNAASQLGVDSSMPQQNGSSSDSLLQVAKKAGDKIATPMKKATDMGDPDLSAAQVEIDMLKREISTHKAQRSIEARLAQALQKEANEMAPDNEQNRCVDISRAVSIDNMTVAKSVYNKYAAEILPIVKNLQRKFQSIIKDEENDDTISGLLMGTRIEARSLYHQDGKYFSRKNFPREAPRLAIGYLCDESGSMSAEAIKQSIKAGILIEALCDRMELPCIISGFTSGRGTAHIISYVEPDSVDGNDKYRLLGMSSRGSTPTAPALDYMAKRLLKINASTRLLIVSTDGSSDNGIRVMNQVVKNAKKKGVIVIGAGIGASRRAIEQEFLNSYLDVSDINKLPDNLLKLIKKLLMY